MEIHKKWALEYEIQSTGLLMSYFNKVFFNFFMWRFERKYKRYLEFKEMEKKEFGEFKDWWADYMKR